MGAAYLPQIIEGVEVRKRKKERELVLSESEAMNQLCSLWDMKGELVAVVALCF